MPLLGFNKYLVDISEKAHTKKLGWEIIDEFEFNENNYIGLALDMEVSVLK